MTDEHSCGFHCQRPACVDARAREWEEQRRRIADLVAERDALKALLDRISHHGTPMLASGEYRQGALDALESVRKIANAALAAKVE